MNPATRLVGVEKVSASIRKLESWMRELDLEFFSFVNTTQKTGEVTIKDVDWDTLKAVLPGYTKVLCLGGFPHRCLEKLGVEHFKLPHPSPRNRLLDPSYIQETLKRCRAYLNKGKST